LPMKNKPNIVLIFPDQHRGDAMGCMGNPAVITPNLDRLASEGVMFNRCYTNSPLCMPARASLISGKYVNEHGVWNNEAAADRYGPSHVRNVRDAGYHTALIGKTHLYVHHGNDHTKHHIQELKDWGYEDIHELAGFMASAVLDNPYTDELAAKGLLDIHRDYIKKMYAGMRSGEILPWEEPPSPLPVEDNLDYYCGRKAVEWINHYQGDKPFYLQVLFPGPHNPFDAPTPYRDKYDPETIPAGILDAPREPLSGLVTRSWEKSRLEHMTPDQKRLMSACYYGKITLIDERIGAIVKALEQQGLLENTWIIYTSDHGEMLGDHRLVHKVVFYDGAALVPCIIRPPGGAPGWTSSGLTDLLDIAATILDIAGAEPLRDSENRSLGPQVLGGPEGPAAQTGKDAVFSEVIGYSTIITDRYKMAVETKSGRVEELYDLKNDPAELNNLAHDPAMKKLRQELLASLTDRLLIHLDTDKYQLFEEQGRITSRGMLK